MCKQTHFCDDTFVYTSLSTNVLKDKLHGYHLTCLTTCFVLVLGNKANLPEMTAAQVKKLRHLTIVSLATQNKVHTIHICE